MRRMILSVLAAAVMGAAGGCLAVSATEHKEVVQGVSSEVVEVDGHVYVVNKSTGEVREVDMSSPKPMASSASEAD